MFLISGSSFTTVSVIKYEPRDFGGKVNVFWNHAMVERCCAGELYVVIEPAVGVALR